MVVCKVKNDWLSWLIYFVSIILYSHLGYIKTVKSTVKLCRNNVQLHYLPITVQILSHIVTLLVIYLGPSYLICEVCCGDSDKNSKRGVQFKEFSLTDTVLFLIFTPLSFTIILLFTVKSDMNTGQWLGLHKTEHVYSHGWWKTHKQYPSLLKYWLLMGFVGGRVILSCAHSTSLQSFKPILAGDPS